MWNVRRMCWELKRGEGMQCDAVNWASVLECAGCVGIKTHEQEKEEEEEDEGEGTGAAG